MSRFVRPGYALALLVLSACIAYAVTRSLWGIVIIAMLEAAFWAATQYVRDFRRRLKQG